MPRMIIVIGILTIIFVMISIFTIAIIVIVISLISHKEWIIKTCATRNRKKETSNNGNKQSSHNKHPQIEIKIKLERQQIIN